MAEIIEILIENNEKTIKDCVFYYESSIREILDQKGGNSFSFTAIDTSTNDTIIENCLNPVEHYSVWDKFRKEVLTSLEYWKGEQILFVFYSRQAFEIDNFEEVKPDPYLENDRYVWFSGSITNLDEIEKALGKKFTDPSQAVAYYDDLLDMNIIIKGVFSAFVYDRKLKKRYWLHNGVPIWTTSYEYNSSKKHYNLLIEWKCTHKKVATLNPGNYDYPELVNKLPYYFYDYSDENEIIRIKENTKYQYYVLFSGGVDSIISTYNYIRSYVKEINGGAYMFLKSAIKSALNKLYKKDGKYIFVYFDYGSKASKQEIVALKKFYNLIKKDFPELEIEYRIINVRNLFIEFKKFITNENLDSTDIDGRYFPYKNTEMAVLLGIIIDRDLEKELFRPFIIFGSDLSKSNKYLEYNQAWHYAIENIIMYSGKNYKYTEIISPFTNLNRSNLMFYAIKQFGFDKTKKLLDIAYSCVDPNENGEPCGKCENCKLRNESFKEAVKYIKKNFFKKN